MRSRKKASSVRQPRTKVAGKQHWEKPVYRRKLHRRWHTSVTLGQNRDSCRIQALTDRVFMKDDYLHQSGGRNQRRSVCCLLANNS